MAAARLRPVSVSRRRRRGRRVAAEAERDPAAGQRSRDVGKAYELDGVTAIGDSDIAEVPTKSVGRRCVRCREENIDVAAQ